MLIINYNKFIFYQIKLIVAWIIIYLVIFCSADITQKWNLIEPNEGDEL